MRFDVQVVEAIKPHLRRGFMPNYRFDMDAFEVRSADGKRRYGSLLTYEAVADKVTDPVEWYNAIVAENMMPELSDPLGR